MYDVLKISLSLKGLYLVIKLRPRESLEGALIDGNAKT